MAEQPPSEANPSRESEQPISAGGNGASSQSVATASTSGTQPPPPPPSSSSTGLTASQGSSNRSPSPGFPSPSSTFVPPPSDEEETARMKALDIAGRADGARWAAKSGGGAAEVGPRNGSIRAGEDDDDQQLQASGSSPLDLAQTDQPDARSALVINLPADGAAAGDAASDGGVGQPARATSSRPPFSPSGSSSAASSGLQASSPRAPSEDEMAFARATARSFPGRQSSQSTSSRQSSDQAGGRRHGSETNQPSHQHQHQHQQTSQQYHQQHDDHPHHHHHHHHHHAQGIQGTATDVPEGRPHVLGSTSTHSKTHPGTIMYPQPDDSDGDDRPLPGDRSRPSQERVQRMHETIEQRDRDYEAEQDAKHKKQTSDRAEREARELANPPAKRPPLPTIVVRDYAYPPDDERFRGQGPLRASLFYSNDGEEGLTMAAATTITGPGASWGFGGWKADHPSGGRGDEDEDDDDEAEEGEWHDDDGDDEDDDEERHDKEPGHAEFEPDPIEPGKYEALYAFQSEADSELSLREGDLVLVHRSGGVGWAVATLLSAEGEPLLDDGGTGRPETEGLVPSGYLRPLRP